MAREVAIRFSSGSKKPKNVLVKNNIHRWVRDLLRLHSNREDDVNELVIYWNKSQSSIDEILFMDSGLGETEEGFSSNLDFEGQIKDLHAQIKKLEREFKQEKARADKFEAKWEKNEKKLDSFKRPVGRPKKNA